MRLLRRNLVLVYGAYGVSLVTGLIATPIIVDALGQEQYGVWAFIGSAVVFLSLLEFGVGPSVVRFAAEQRGRGALEETSALSSVALVVYGVIALVSLPLALLLAWLVPHALDLTGDLVWPARIATLLVAGTVLARFPLALGTNLLLAQQRWDVVSGAGIVSGMAYLAIVAALLLDGGGLVLLAGITLGATVLRLAVPLAWLPRELPGLRARWSLVRREDVRRLLAFSWDNFLIHVASRVVFFGGVVIVGVILGSAAAALYGVAAKLFAVVFGAGTAATNLLYPAFAELEGRDDEAGQRTLALRGIRLGTAFMAVLALPLVAIPERLLTAWVGDAFAESASVLLLLALALLFHQPIHVLTQYLVARGRQRPLALASLAFGVANIALAVGLVFAVGIWGVALATLLAEGAFALLVLPRLVRSAGGPAPRELAGAVGRPLLAVAAGGIATFGVITPLFDPAGLFELALVGVLWLVVGGAVAWLLGLGAEQRRALARRLAVPAAPPADELG